MPIIQILTEKQISKYNAPPILTSLERRRYSYIPQVIVKRSLNIYSEDNRLGFLMQFFYFRLIERFFPVQSYNESDIMAVAKRYGLANAHLANYRGSTYHRHQEIVCDLLGYRRLGENERNTLYSIAIEQCKKQVRPRKILGKLVQYLSDNMIEGSSYYPLVEIITTSINIYEKELQEELTLSLGTEMYNRLDSLLEPAKKKDNSDVTMLISFPV